jgi:ankyrin repeat protein
MSILRLPDDILFLLADNLSRERDINALAQTSRRLYPPLNRLLYQYNIRHSNSSALRWGVYVGCEGTVRKCLELGAPIECKPKTDPNDEDADSDEDISETPLVNIAAERGYDGVLKPLLDYGANPNENRQFPRVPLGLAIQNGHDAAMRVLLAREDTKVTLPSTPFSQQPLHFALERGSLESVLLLIERGADLQQYESTGARALHPAIRSGSQALVEFLMSRGCNPLSCCGYTALSLAAVMGHQSLVQYFLAHGVDPDIRDRTGFTALGHAAKEGHADIVETLLAWGVRTENVGEDGETALCWAARENHEMVVDVLLRHGVDPNSPNSHGIRPIHWAVTNGSIPLFKALLARGARIDIQTDGETLLHIAVRRNDQPLVEILIQLGIEVDKPDNAGRTALTVAAAGGHLEMMELLLAKGADMTIRDQRNWAPLHTALWRHQDEAVEFLLRRGADPDFATEHGPDRLIDAVANQMVRVTRYLLENGVDPDPVSQSGRTPLLTACEFFRGNDYEIAEMLLRTGRANVHARNAEGRTPIMCATGQENPDPRLVQLLVTHGANVNDKDEDGWSCLASACAAGNEEIARTLVEAGADLNTRDSYGQTPLDQVHSQSPLYEYLLEKGAEL